MPEEKLRDQQTPDRENCESDEKEDTSLHLLRGLRIILSIILFIILACVIWIVPISSWWIRLIVAIIAVAIIVLFH